MSQNGWHRVGPGDVSGEGRVRIVLRDLVGLDAVTVCEALGVSPGNQRVLLHRARSSVRATLTETYVDAA